jgi:hypothetical protein
MTAKEKAEDLIDSFVRDGYDLVMSEDMAKRCALIAVDEIIKLPNAIGINDLIEYWEQVKQEIEKL